MSTVLVAAAVSGPPFYQVVIAAAAALIGGGAAGAVVAARTEKNIEAKRVEREKQNRYKEARGAARRLAARIKDIRSTLDAISTEWPARPELQMKLTEEDEKLLSIELPHGTWEAVATAREELKNVEIGSTRFSASSDESRELRDGTQTYLEQAENLLQAFEQSGRRGADN